MNLEALWGLRLRTPRLELRLPTHDEIVELYRVAEAGIHPSDEMPFGEAWTDDLRLESFVEFHESKLKDWAPESWDCNFVTFKAGRVIGTQAVHGKEFGRTKEVGTGSWLGAPFQGHGYGTEQRAAVLEFAFRGLRAQAATSGSLIHNLASRRVSEKLGYEVTGMGKLAPRGEPILHYEYRLERGDWRCPITVEIEGLADCLPLFGAFPRSG